MEYKYIEVPERFLKYAKPSCRTCHGLGREGYIIEGNTKIAKVCRCVKKNVELDRIPKKMIHKYPIKDKFKRDKQFSEIITDLESRYSGGEIVHANI